MDDGNGNQAPDFNPPENPRERATWLRGWIKTIFNVYGSVIDQAKKTMPDKNLGQMKGEIEAAKTELMHLITPENWEKNEDSQ